MAPEVSDVIQKSGAFQAAVSLLDALQGEKDLKQAEIQALNLRIQAAKDDIAATKAALRASIANLT